jgi:hypothetical protein
MFTPSRHDARQFFFDIWSKHKAQQALGDMEKITLAILLAHPEYHYIVDNPDQYAEQEWPPEGGQTNPFLHMSLHMAIEEQRSIDQPFGIRSLYAQLALRHGDEHRAQHEIMECLAEMIWQAQRQQSSPDLNVYLDGIRAKLGMGPEATPRPRLDEI